MFYSNNVGLQWFKVQIFLAEFTIYTCFTTSTAVGSLIRSFLNFIFNNNRTVLTL